MKGTLVSLVLLIFGAGIARAEETPPAEPPPETPPATSGQSGNYFNPAISVIGNFWGRRQQQHQNLPRPACGSGWGCRRWWTPGRADFFIAVG
jgi:hypothetical protein